MSPLILSLLQERGIGESEGGIVYCEVEYDSPDIMSSGLAMEFSITSMPTLLSFHMGFAAHERKVVKGEMLRDGERLAEWIREEARRRDTGPDGTGIFGGWFGGR